MIITVEAVLATRPCAVYPPERIRELVGGGLDPADRATLEVVLALPPEDARWILSKLLTTADAVLWARACADRAGMYATATDASARCAAAAAYASCYASRSADASAAYASCSASCYAAAARSAAAACSAAAATASAATTHYDAEHRLACQHALDLLAVG